ncbi:MAG: hypothetical protein PHX20_02770, partial [Candidatus Omnitrophica bacterium]|nr:hypothetical protein [Candidatus Omnitrophota bacterium]
MARLKEEAGWKDWARSPDEEPSVREGPAAEEWPGKAETMAELAKTLSYINHGWLDAGMSKEIDRFIAARDRLTRNVYDELESFAFRQEPTAKLPSEPRVGDIIVVQDVHVRHSVWGDDCFYICSGIRPVSDGIECDYTVIRKGGAADRVTVLHKPGERLLNHLQARRPLSIKSGEKIDRFLRSAGKLSSRMVSLERSQLASAEEDLILTEDDLADLDITFDARLHIVDPAVQNALFNYASGGIDIGEARALLILNFWWFERSRDLGDGIPVVNEMLTRAKERYEALNASGEEPAAATRENLPLKYLLRHPVLNALIRLALKASERGEIEVECVYPERGHFEEVYFFGSEADVSFRDIFDRLALAKARKRDSHAQKASLEDEMDLVSDMLAIAERRAPNGRLDKKLVEMVKLQLELQIDHFGIENYRSIYTLKRYRPNTDEIIAHAEVEQSVHKRCIDTLAIAEMRGGEAGSTTTSRRYREEWRKDPDGVKIGVNLDIGDISQKHPSVSGAFTYNEFVQAAHDIAEAEHPLAGIAPALDAKKSKASGDIIVGGEAPVASTRDMELIGVDEAILRLEDRIPARSKALKVTAELKAEVISVARYMKALLPEENKLTLAEIIDCIVPEYTNWLHEYRRGYGQTHNTKELLPPVFTFLPKVYPEYAGESPRYISVYLRPQFLVLEVIHSKVKDDKDISAKGGDRLVYLDTSAFVVQMKGDKGKKIKPALLQVADLSSTMKPKSLWWASGFDGSKTFSMANTDILGITSKMTNAQKAEIIKKELLPCVASFISSGILCGLCRFGPDMNTGELQDVIIDEAYRVQKELGVEYPMLASTSGESKKGSFSHAELRATSLGAIETILPDLENEELTKQYGINPKKVTVSMMGFGEVTTGGIYWLKEEHPDLAGNIRFCGFSNVPQDDKTAGGGVNNPDGFDLDELVALADKRNKQLHESGGIDTFRLLDEIKGPCRKLPGVEGAREVLFQGADIVIPAAVADVFTTIEDVRRLKEAGTKMLYEMANNAIKPNVPVTADNIRKNRPDNMTEERLEANLKKYEGGTIYLEDVFDIFGIYLKHGPITNGGGIRASSEQAEHWEREGRDTLIRLMAERGIHVQDDIADMAILHTMWLTRKHLETGKSPFRLFLEGVDEIEKTFYGLLNYPDDEMKRLTATYHRANARMVDARHFAAADIAHNRFFLKGLKYEDLIGQVDDKTRTIYGREITARMALFALGRIPLTPDQHEVVVKKAIEVLGDTGRDPQVRKSAAECLGFILAGEALSALDKAKSDSNKNIVVWAKWASDRINAASSPASPSGYLFDQVNFVLYNARLTRYMEYMAGADELLGSAELEALFAGQEEAPEPARIDFPDDSQFTPYDGVSGLEPGEFLRAPGDPHVWLVLSRGPGSIGYIRIDQWGGIETAVKNIPLSGLTDGFLQAPRLEQDARFAELSASYTSEFGQEQLDGLARIGIRYIYNLPAEGGFPGNHTLAVLNELKLNQEGEKVIDFIKDNMKSGVNALYIDPALSASFVPMRGFDRLRDRIAVSLNGNTLDLVYAPCMEDVVSETLANDDEETLYFAISEAIDRLSAQLRIEPLQNIYTAIARATRGRADWELTAIS